MLGEQAATGPKKALKDIGVLSLSGMQQEQDAGNAHSFLHGIPYVFWIACLRAQLCSAPVLTVDDEADERVASRESIGAVRLY